MRRFKTTMILLGLLVMMLLPTEVFASETTSVTVSAAKASSVKNGLVKEKGKYYYYVKGKKLTSAWKTINGQKYYFWTSGKAVTDCVNVNGKAYVFNSKGHLVRPKKTGFYKDRGNTFYLHTNGQADTGWFIVNGKLYRADPKGRLYKNRVYQGIAFSDTGSVKPNTASRLKLKAMQIVSSITTPQMTKEQKLKACWNYVVHSGKFRYRDTSPNLSQPGWYKEFAYNMLVSQAGSCSSFACAFAALASEAGYDPYIIYGRVPGSRDGAADGMTRHCWVKIDGKHYDPEGTWAGWAGYVYNDTYYPMRYTVTQVSRFNG